MGRLSLQEGCYDVPKSRRGLRARNVDFRSGLGERAEIEILN